MGATGISRGGRRAVRILNLLVAVTIASALPATSAATVTILVPFPEQQLYLIVGSSGPTIDTVSMNVPGSMLGNGTPIAGSPVLRFIVIARGPAGSPGFELSVDSSAPLSNGSGGFIPMTAIAWTSADGDFPSPGSFNGASSQLLITAPTNRAIVDFLTFRYSNVGIPPAGTYNGRVRYTLTVP